jgi:excisionase family DNA binding protein
MQQNESLGASAASNGNGAIDDRWLTPRQAAARAQVHEATLRRLIKAGRLRHARVGAGRKLIRIRTSWLDAALDATSRPVEVR